MIAGWLQLILAQLQLILAEVKLYLHLILARNFDDCRLAKSAQRAKNVYLHLKPLLCQIFSSST
jgi:hypothetical protein